MVPRWLLAVFIALYSLAACKPGPKITGAVTIDQSAAGSRVVVKTNQVLVVQLASNPSTGYSWGVVECDLSVLQPQGDPEYVTTAGDRNKVGAGGWEVFRFQPVNPGRVRLKLAYRRPWEKDVVPVETFEVDVTVE